MIKYLKIGIVLSLVWWAQSALAQDTIPLNTSYAFEATNQPDYTYSWWYTNETGIITEFESTANKTEEYYWDTEGEFQIMVQARDKWGCLSEIIFRNYVVIEMATNLIVYAGNDTTIGSSNPYQLQATVSDNTGLNYLWEPAESLDDPSILNPVFTPGSTTTFVLIVSDSSGNQISDTVTISVSEILADAGTLAFIEEGSTVELDGSLSIGKDIEYLWTTNNGSIVSGENTASPIVSSVGMYYLKVTDFYGSISIDSVQVKLGGAGVPIVSAGNDTLIGSCNPYQLQALISDTTGLTYSWKPAENLDDPTFLNPIFTPSTTTTFILTVTSADGIALHDTVEISISDIYADAGVDFVIEGGTTAMLDGTASSGETLKYLWTTFNGTIDSGENTANPIINSTGTYYLEVTDFYACKAIDSVVVSRVTLAPVARNDYDTTVFQTAVNIPVLNNDEDLNGNLDPSSLSIVQYPLNGSVYINYDNYTVTYTPADGFTGNDIFEYQICNLSNKCDNASVYVVVIPLDFLLPEAFTPNGDNINDYFEIRGIEYYEGNSITIINRWGEKVYEAKNYGIDTTPKYWDGKWTTGGNNKDLPTGTYFYVLDLGNGQKPIAGSIYIDR